MASTGLTLCGTGEDNSGIGSNHWSSPTNITADDDNGALECFGATHYLVGRNYGFSITGTIVGITVEIKIRTFFGVGETLYAQLQDETGTLVGSSKNIAIPHNASYTTYTYGSSSDVWGASLTDSIVNDADFGVRLWVPGTASECFDIDYVKLNVEYSTGFKHSIGLIMG